MPQLQFFAYISRSKVEQLHDQLTDMVVEKRSLTRGRQRQLGGEVSTNPLLGLFKVGAKAGAAYHDDVKDEGGLSVVHRLADLLEHIDTHETVLDLRELIDQQAGTRLDAFCYSYSGPFRVLGEFGTHRYSSGLAINSEALDRASGDIIISKDLLIEPARQENAFAETGPNGGRLVSSVCLIRSEHGNYAIQLACSLRYFSDMGGHWDATDNEWSVVPHSGNYHFFEGREEQWFDALIFINGLRNRTIMGSRLVLAYSSDPAVTI